MAQMQQNPAQKTTPANKQQAAKQDGKSQSGSDQKSTSKPAKKDDQQNRSGKH